MIIKTKRYIGDLNIICGCLLGVGFIGKNGRFEIKHVNKDYVEFLGKRLNSRTRTYKKKGRVNQFYQYHIFSMNGLFQLRKSWYLSGEKVVSRELVLNNEILAHWYLQKGSLCKNSIKLFTKFRKEDVYFLIKRLEIDLGIKATINKFRKQWIIRISKTSCVCFMEKIKPYIMDIPTFSFKISNFDNSCRIKKLTMQKANKIRVLYDEGMTQTELAKMFKISQTAVNKIINNRIYKIITSDCHTGGSALVEIQY